MRFSVVNIGCKVNRVEVDAAAAELMAQGAVFAADGEVDAVVVNTCTVTAEADKKTRKAVRGVLKAHPGAQVIVTGCAAVMNPDWFEELDERVHVVAKPDIAARAWELVEGGRAAAIDENDGDLDAALGADKVKLRVGGEFRTRVGIKAQDGCNNACTFCIVHVARGTSVSVSFEKVAAEARAHSLAGVRELLLTGINLGAYNDAGRKLPDLLRELMRQCPGSRLRIGSVEPIDVSDELIELMAESNGRICRHLHLPLQSGSSRVLAEMNRPYDADYFLQLVTRLRNAMPQFSVSTDIIVGFPGESEADFADTLEVARQSRFSKIHVFRYSKREGTPAAARPDQVAAQVSAERAQRLQALGNELRIADACSRLGTVERVLVERKGSGLTESYHPVRWDATDSRSSFEVGELVAIALTEASADGIFLL